MFLSFAPSLAAGARVVGGDPASSRTVYAIVIALLAIGAALVVLGIWVIRQTRVDPELLAPLERMADRSWRRRDPAGRGRLLDDVRPDGAEPIKRVPSEPQADADLELSERRVPTFDDLPGVGASAPGDDAAAEVADADEHEEHDEDEVVSSNLDEVVEPSNGDGLPPDPLGDRLGIGRLDVNVEPVEHLASLPGVGPATAAAIVAEREAGGPFRNVDELERVPGIGPGKMATLRRLVTAIYVEPDDRDDQEDRDATRTVRVEPGPTEDAR